MLHPWKAGGKRGITVRITRLNLLCPLGDLHPERLTLRPNDFWQVALSQMRMKKRTRAFGDKMPLGRVPSSLPDYTSTATGNLVKLMISLNDFAATGF
jgi:hypothetical protein